MSAVIQAILSASLIVLAAGVAEAHDHRSSAARRAFMAATGHGHGWPGHVIDHIVPLACGGPDRPDNMQWQTIADAKAKDRVERRGCRKQRR